MRKRILWSINLVAFICTLIIALVITLVSYHNLHDNMVLSVRNQGDLLAKALQESKIESILPPITPYRVSIISSEGTLLFDNKEQSTENHLERPEIKQALELGIGESERASDTIHQTTFYYAIKLPDGSILRVASSMKSIYSIMTTMLILVFFVVILLFFITLWLSRKITKKLIDPINQLDVNQPELIENYDELAPLIHKLQRQQEDLKLQQKNMKEQEEKYGLYLEKMQEGLILLDKDCKIIAVNPSTIEIFQAPLEDYQHRFLPELTRNADLTKAVEKAIKGELNTIDLVLNGRIIQLHCNPIVFNNQVDGVLCLLLDISDKRQAEHIRQEFSANVSHELKTPLTSISGYAEIIKNNMVSPEDIPNFAGKIYDESQELIALIDDILKLSKFDENRLPMAMESLDIYENISHVIDRLTPFAEKKGLELTFHGTSMMIEGVPQIMTEIFYNLITNAIRYTNQGSVAITLTEDEISVSVSVVDTGIGIAPEHQSRVFERFYREDNSHSKATGGTGLGLAIVKHGVKYHNGTIELKSEPNIGTTILIKLPKKQK